MFTKPDLESMHIIEGTYDPLVMLLSFIIAFGASYTAIYINRRINGKGFFHKNIWLVLASLAMGLGIWSMHYVGMSAFVISIPMKHNLVLTIISVIPAIGASYMAFYLTNSDYKKVQTFIAAGFFMGCGIALMHYIGMAAMEMDAKVVYNPVLFGFSILIAIVASFASLYIFSITDTKMEKVLVKSIAAFLMAIAVTSMHYTGMLAMSFYVEGPIRVHTHDSNMIEVALFVTIGIGSLFGLAILASRLDSYVDFRMKYFDALTQLPNHNQFTEDQHIKKNTKMVAIVHLNNVEKYILAYGYSFGDAIVKSVIEIMQTSLPKETKLYRTEANRFTVIHAPAESVQNTINGLRSICLLLERPLNIDERMVSIEAVFAVSQSDEKKAVHEHFTNAIAVLHAPSTQSRHGIIKYDPKIHTFNFERQLSLDIQRAMDENELFIVYQPKVHPEQNSVVGIEALMRWKHPVYGIISPAVFIPILENANRISDVTDWLIERVCQQLAAWTNIGIELPQISINIPGMYLTSPRLNKVINRSLLKYKIQASKIELEITETSVIHDIHNAISAVRTFREKGLSVALDDFGTGLSSLSYLKEIPISTIKIDKSFIDGVPNSAKDASILKSIIHLCYSLDLNVLVEGVETKEQVQFIMGLEKVPIVQGYYYSKPLTVEEYEHWWKKRKEVGEQNGEISIG
ncbi:bifunctional diguanylate cyclase/phosphodiesterase [Solibacillus sp. FSL K6-1126]|uniref:bifunctional diguanylate cyclase/phosphodiesterase n=1 Tax=Solibacillus sp. FSL K6-1126 TaxID=2921463 RepID=UPI0030F80C3C